jgi:ECF sigma factor
MPSASKNVTQLPLDWRQGDQAALNQLMPVVYGELRRLGGQLAAKGKARSYFAADGAHSRSLPAAH